MNNNKMLISICTLIILFFSANLVSVQGKAKPNLKRQPKTIKNLFDFAFVDIPAGSFQMGSTNNPDEEPVHLVTLSKGFSISDREVTQSQWVAEMETNPSARKNCDTCPVENVSWDEVQEFIRKLNAYGDGTYRLPTEAEWEYACRAGSTTDFSFGNDESLLGNYAWYDANAGETSHEVATKLPNAWGLYDMHGSVWEFTSDWYGEYPKERITDPTGPSTGFYRVVRGGGYFVVADVTRSAKRDYSLPHQRDLNTGFRVVRN